MNIRFDAILMPEVVKAIKSIEDGKGVKLENTTWEIQTIKNRDIENNCFIITSFEKGSTITVKNPEIIDNKNEENTN